MMKTVFMGTPELAATILQQLCEKGRAPLAVVTQTAKPVGRGQKVVPSPVETLARTNGIPVFATDNVNAPEIVAAIKAFEPDLILVAAFGQILRAEILALPKLYCLNVHASLLPKYRGASPVQRAIWNGDAETGVAIQKMAKKLDSGDILLVKKTAIHPQETSSELMGRLAVLGGECLIDTIALIESGKATFTPQDESQVTFAGKIAKSDAVLDWNLPASKLVHQIHALNPWPVAETTLSGTRLKIYRAMEKSVASKKPPGEILAEKDSLTVYAGEGTALTLTEIQLENKKKLGIKEFLAGYRGNFPFSKAGT